jgi:hypothetical protein
VIQEVALQLLSDTSIKDVERNRKSLIHNLLLKQNLTFESDPVLADCLVDKKYLTFSMLKP